MAERKDDQIPGSAGRGNCTECGGPLAPDQRYCLDCGARRGRLPGAVAGTLAALSAKGKGIAAAAGAKPPRPQGGEDGWSWMPSPQAIAIAVIGMLALGVGLGSAMSEIAASAPLSTILLEYPHRAAEAPPPAEEPEEVEAPEETEAPVVAEAPEEAAPVEEVAEEPPPEEAVEEPPPEESSSGQPPPEEFNPFEEGETEIPGAAEGSLPEVKHAFLIVLGEGGYEETFGAGSAAPYLAKTLPRKGELIPNYYGVTGGVLANEIALLGGQGPTPETAVNCPNYTAVAPATVSVFAEQVEGNGCVYPSTVESLPTQLTAAKLKWRAYVEDIEKGAAAGQPINCRKPALGGPDSSPTAVPGDQYTTWRNPVVYFSAIAESAECGKLDVGFEALTRDLKAKKKTPALSLIFPDACHAGGELECEPGAPKGAQGIAASLKTLVPAIMASPAYEEGGLILITSAQALQAGEHPDPSACCLAPEYPNLPPATGTTTPAATTPTTTTTPTPTTTPKTTPPAATTPSKTTESSTSATESSTSTTEAPTTTTYTEESVLPSGGGGKVGLLMISPFVEPGKVAEAEYANHFTLLKTLEEMFKVEPLGYAAEEEVPALSATLFKAVKEEEGEEESSGPATTEGSKHKRAGAAGDRVLRGLPRSPGAPPARAGRRRGTS